MGKMPPGSGACCLPNVDGITYIQLGPQGTTVGMSGLDKVFQQLLAMGRCPDEATDAELVGMARKFNWIPDKESIVVDYAEALWLFSRCTSRVRRTIYWKAAEK